VKVLLVFSPADDPGLLKKVIIDFDVFDLKILVDEDIQVFAKSGRIVVSDGL
jgi:hypothetical protein